MDVQPDRVRHASRDNLIGKYIHRFLVQPVGVAIDNLKVTRILLMGNPLRNERANRGFDKFRTTLVLPGQSVHYPNQILGQSDIGFDSHGTTILKSEMLVNARLNGDPLAGESESA